MTFKKLSEDPDFKDLTLRMPEDAKDAVYKCAACRDLGWVDFTVKRTSFPVGDYNYARICECELRRRAAIAVKMLEHRHKIFKGLGFDTYHPEDDSQRQAVAICRRFIAGWLSLSVPEGPYEGRGREEKALPAQDLVAKQPIPEHQGLLFYGPVGTGKTSLLLTTAKALAKKDCTIVEWCSATMLAARLRGPMQPNAFESQVDIINELVGCRLLFIDDLGREAVTPYIQESFFAILDGRHHQCKPTFVTTNLKVTDYELELRLGEGLFSRLKDMCLFHKITGKDRRMR